MSRFTPLLLTMLVTGCAGTDITPVKQTATRQEVGSIDGIRYYEPAPFLLVYSDSRGNLKSQIVILPDLDRMRSVDPFAVLAKNNSTLTFSNGMLTQAKIEVDETVVPTQVFESLKAIAGTVAGAAFDQPEDRKTTVPSPKLFRIVIEQDKVRLVGGETTPESFEIKYTAKEGAPGAPAAGGQ